MGVLIKSGRIVTALDEWTGDIYCREGKIVALGESLDGDGKDDVVDASGQYVFPGGIDPHVHMELPFMGSVSADDFETGTAAGIAGGTTTILDFVIPNRGEAPLEALASWRMKAKKSVADYGLHMCLTWWGDETATTIEKCVREEGIPSFKVFLAYRGAIGVDDTELIHVMRTASDLGALIMVHAEHGEMVADLQNRLIAEGNTDPIYHAYSRPAPLEGEATARAIMIARMTCTNIYIVHMTCHQAVRAVAEARERGQLVYGETCPQYLLLDQSVYEKADFEGAAYVMSPPIRPRGHQKPLWDALSSGILQIVGSDHCPFNQKDQKEMGREDFRLIPNGAAGIEHRMALLYTFGVREGKLNLHQFVDITSTGAAKIFGLYPRKGSIMLGADADLVVWDPEGTSRISANSHHHNCDRSIYEGFVVKGLPSTVIASGRIQYQEGDLRVERGAGRYLPRSLT